MAAGFALSELAVWNDCFWLFLASNGIIHGVGYGIAIICNQVHAVQWFYPHSGIGATIAGVATGLSIEYFVLIQEKLVEVVGIEKAFCAVAIVMLLPVVVVPFF